MKIFDEPKLPQKEYCFLTPVEILLERPYGHTMWFCRCRCGTMKKVRESDLIRHRVKSCRECSRKYGEIIDDLIGEQK